MINAERIATVLPDKPNNSKLKILKLPFDILVAGALMSHNIPNKALVPIITICHIGKGTLMSVSSSSMTCNSFLTGTRPMSPKMFCDSQNCNVPKNIKTPAKPKP